MQDNITKLALDIGNAKVKMILGELSTEGLELRILDYVETASEGIKRSVVEDSEALAESIKRALKELEARTGREFDRVSLGISSDRIKSKTEHGRLEFDEKEIQEKDIEGLINSVKREIVLEDEVVLEEEIYNVRVNNSGIIRNPVGQTGKSLQGDIHLITLKQEEVDQIVQVVNKAGLQVEDLYLNASASAKSTLELEDKQMGVALIDIGEGATDIAIYKNDKIIYTKSLSIGGMHFVNDISYILQIAKREAKEILEKLISKDYSNGVISVSNKSFSIEEIKDIIDARTGDLINFISMTIEESGFNGYLGKGLAFTGGAVVLDDVFNKIGNKMECAVSKVHPMPLRGLEEVSPSMSTVVGILLNKLEKEFKKHHDINEEAEENTGVYIEEVPGEELGSSGFRIEDFEENDEEEESSDGTFGKIRKWISNFI